MDIMDSFNNAGKAKPTSAAAAEGEEAPAPTEATQQQEADDEPDSSA